MSTAIADRETLRPAAFRKSSFSTGTDPQCVEVGWKGDGAGNVAAEVRDSKTTFGHTGDRRLSVNASQFAQLIAFAAS